MKTAYKLLRKRNGKLYPLYVLSDKETPVGVWIAAESGELQANGKVKAKLGDGLCYRPGWHLSDLPVARHIYTIVNGERVQKEGTVWCEVLYKDDVNYQAIANENGRNKRGVVVAKNAYLKYVPTNGYYKYKTSPQMEGEWAITGEMKIVRELSGEEVDQICLSAGVKPQKRAM